MTRRAGQPTGLAGPRADVAAAGQVRAQHALDDAARGAGGARRGAPAAREVAGGRALTAWLANARVGPVAIHEVRAGWASLATSASPGREVKLVRA